MPARLSILMAALLASTVCGSNGTPQDVPRAGAVMRSFHTDLSFPTQAEVDAAVAGRPVVLTFKVDPAGVLSGVEDAPLQRAFTAIDAAGGRWFVGYWHEPEASLSAQDYRDAFHHVADLIGERPHIATIAVLMASTFAAGDADTWYPGDDVVDALGVDGYDWRGCRDNGGRAAPGAGSRSLGEVLGDAHAFAVAHGKPLLATEFGTAEDPEHPDARLRWLRDAARWLANHREVIGGAYFDHGTGEGFRCEWSLNDRERAAVAELWYTG